MAFLGTGMRQLAKVLYVIEGVVVVGGYIWLYNWLYYWG